MKQSSKLFKFVGLLLVVGLLFAALPAGQVRAATPTPTEVVYDSLLVTIPPNVPSLGYQATQTAEFGDYIRLMSANSKLATATVTMSTWALHSAFPSMPDAGWTHPITLNIYNVIPGSPNRIGTLIGTKTQTFPIPWRPEANSSCSTPTAWRAADNNCYNGFAFNIIFDFSDTPVLLPQDVIIGVAYNTNTWGAAPIGAPGPYESLNLGLQGIVPPALGTDVNLTAIFWNTKTAAWYADGGTAGEGTFREDTNWSYPLAIKITAETLSTVYVDDSWTGITLGTDPDGSGPARSFGWDSFLTIQEGVNAVAAGGTVNVAAGTYPENVLINKYVQVIGSGNGDTPSSSTIVTTPTTIDTKVGLFNLAASGQSAVYPILLQNMRLKPAGQAAISVGRFPESTGTIADFVKLDNLKVIGTNSNPQTEQERGLYVDLTSTLRNVEILNSSFDNLHYGFYFQKNVNITDLSTVSNLTMTSGSISHNNAKGIYAEKLSNATFTDVTISQNGFSSIDIQSYFLPWMSGVDINLKAGNYQNISFIRPIITDNALGGAKEGVGIAIKARSDGATYGPNPATLVGVLIERGQITGNERGIRIGEPGKGNSGPTNVVIQYNSIYGNLKTYTGTDGSAYGGVINVSTAPISAKNNWWGSAAGPAAGSISGVASYIPWCLDATCTTFGYPPVKNVTQGTYFNTIQAAINVATALDTIEVSAGTYIENVTVNKDITLDGVTDPFTSPAVVQGLITITADGATVSDLKVAPGNVTGQVAAISVYAGNTTVSGNLIDGMNGDGTKTIKGIYVNSGGPAVLFKIAVTGNTVKNISNTGKGTDGIQIQGVLNEVTVTGNTVKAISSTGWAYGIEVTPTGSAPSTPPLGVVITGNTVDGITAPNNAAAALSVDAVDATHPADASQVQVHLNTFINAPYALINKDAAHQLSADKNWFGSAFGPQAPISGDIDVIQWCANAGCTEFAPNAQGVIELSGNVPNVSGGINIYVPHLTYLLKNGTVIQNSSPCFNIHASYVTITTESIGGAKCVPTVTNSVAANGINVDPGLVNITIEGIEFVGTTGNNGINFAGPVTDIIVTDNWFHDFASDGIEFASQPTGVINIQGNLFQSNTRLGINAGTFTVDAKYNSWGNVSGPVAGDGKSDNVVAIPYTHTAVELKPVGTAPVVGAEFTIDVVGVLKNITGADFTLLYNATEFEFVKITEAATALFNKVPTAAELVYLKEAGKVRFAGTSSELSSETGTTLYKVTFKALKTGASDISIDPISDIFSMFPGSGPSTNIYAAHLDTETITVHDTLAVTDANLKAGTVVGTYAALPGNLTDGFTMVLDPAVPWYYFNTTTIDSNRLLADGSYPFYLSTAPTVEVFKLVVSGSGTQFFLRDTYANDGTPLRVQGNFAPLGAYTYVGTVADALGSTAKVSLKITFVAPLAVTNANLKAGIVVGTYAALPGNLTDGFTMVLNPAVPWYYFNTTTIDSNRPLANGSYPFVLSGTTQEVFKLVVSGNGTEFFLRDTYANDGTPLRVQGNFAPLGAYTYVGTVADALGSTAKVSLTITFKRANVPSVVGTVSMQGRTTRAGVLVTLLGDFGYGPYAVPSINQISDNVTFTNLGLGTYAITVSQARYLDLTLAHGATINLADLQKIATLELKAGDANDNNYINISDAVIVGGQYGTGTITSNGDINFDNEVNIQDLALIGGNFDLQSADPSALHYAYGTTWMK